MKIFLKNESSKKIAIMFSLIICLGIFTFIPKVESYYYPFVDPFYSNPFFYDPYVSFYPYRGAAALLSTSGISSTTLLTSLVAAPTTSSTFLSLTSAITLATLGGGINTSTLALLSTTPVPTYPILSTTTLGTPTALLLGGGVSTTTLLLLGLI